MDFLLLISKSTLLLTDSGGLQEEAITLNVPALTLRYNTERPETVTAGGNILVGSDKKSIIKYARKILDNKEFSDKMKNAINPYGQGDSAKLIVDSIENYYGEGLLDIKAPENIMTSFTRKMMFIQENINVKTFEENNNALIYMVFDGDNMKYPSENLNLNGMIISFDLFEN